MASYSFSTLRYMLFFGKSYYPDGGFEDYRGSYGSIEEAEAEVDLRRSEIKLPVSEAIDWWHIVDKVTMTIVKESRDSDSAEENCG